MSGIARSVVKGRRGLRLVLVNLPVLAACTYLYTLGMLHRAHRQIAGQIATQVRVRLWPRRYVPTVPLAALVPGPVDLHLEELTSTFSNVSVDELMALAALVRVSGARTVLEIGTFDGRTALNLAANLPPDGHVYTLDLPPAGPDGPIGDTSSVFPLDPAARKRPGSPAPGARFHHTCWEGRITQLFGDSGRFDFAATLPPEGVDFIFIDGAHTEAYVTSDSLRAIDLLRNGRGVLVWHDYTTWPGVRVALHGLMRRDARFQGLRYIQHTSLAVLCVGDANAP